MGNSDSPRKETLVEWIQQPRPAPGIHTLLAVISTGQREGRRRVFALRRGDGVPLCPGLWGWCVPPRQTEIGSSLVTEASNVIDPEFAQLPLRNLADAALAAARQAGAQPADFRAERVRG